MKGTFGKRERTGEKRAALVSLSNGAARAAQPPAQFANKRLPATIGTSAEKASSKRPGKSKKLLSIYTPANDLSTAPRHAIAAEDEVEYMPPSALGGFLSYRQDKPVIDRRYAVSAPTCSL